MGGRKPASAAATGRRKPLHECKEACIGVRKEKPVWVLARNGKEPLCGCKKPCVGVWKETLSGWKEGKVRKTMCGCGRCGGKKPQLRVGCVGDVIGGVGRGAMRMG